MSHARDFVAAVVEAGAEPPLRIRDGEVVRVVAEGAYVYMDGDRTVEVGPMAVEAQVSGIAAGQIVQVTYIGHAPRITGRRT